MTSGFTEDTLINDVVPSEILENTCEVRKPVQEEDKKTAPIIPMIHAVDHNVLLKSCALDSHCHY